MSYSIEVVGALPSQNPSSKHFRCDPIYHVKDAHGATVATCYDADKARFIKSLLNSDPELWSCGHTAGHHCAKCYQRLSRLSTTLVEIIDALLERLDGNDPVAKKARTDLTQALHRPISNND